MNMYLTSDASLSLDQLNEKKAIIFYLAFYWKAKITVVYADHSITTVQCRLSVHLAVCEPGFKELNWVR